MYLARVLPLPTWVIARINGLIWPFLWGSRIETVSRNTCYLPFKSGGIGLSNLLLKSQALKLAAMVKILDFPVDTNFFLCKYFVGRRLSTLRSQWAFLRDNSVPSAILPTPFYLGCLDTLAKIGSCELISKRIYASLLSLSSSPPVLPRQWSMCIGSGFSLDDHWSLVRDFFTENFKNDLLWLIILRAVKVRDSLRNWGYIDSCVCAFCSLRETIDHCFLNCSRVKRVWAHFVPILTLVLGMQFVSNLLFVFFFLWPSVRSKRATIAPLL